jgi:plastocyanin
VRGLATLAVAVAAIFLSAAPALAAPQSLTYTYGPVQLAPFEVDQGIAFNDVPKPSVDGYITHMQVEVVDARGQKISPHAVMLHHIVFLNLGEPLEYDHHDWTCSTFTGLDGQTKLPALADRFYASGEERNVLDLPPGYGYPVKGKDTWILTWMLMNHHDSFDKAYIQYKLTYETEPVRPAYMVWLDVRNCLSDPVYDVPGGGAPGSTVSRSWTWAATQAGRIVAGGGHLHGGGRSIALTEPDCGGREIFTSRPVYGLPDNPFYQVVPALHEPGPINMSGFTSESGIPVAKGQKLEITANYEDQWPHVRVMGIYGVYFSPDASVTSGCGSLPSDLRTTTAAGPGRGEPPRFVVPLARRPSGRYKRLRGGATIKVVDTRYSRQRVRLRTGARLRWRFQGSLLHNLTVANGPRGFSSPNLDGRRTFSHTFDVPGTYKLFCTLHPTQMSEVVKVGR